MKYLGKEPFCCKPSTPQYEESWDRVFRKFKPDEDVEFRLSEPKDKIVKNHVEIIQEIR